MLSTFIMLIHQEIRAHLRQAFSWITPFLFFILVVCLFPLSIGPNISLLKNIAPGIIWVAALLSIILSMGNLFRNDAQEGFLELLLLSPYPLTYLILCKIISHWIMYCVPLILISPLLGFLFYLTHYEILVLCITLLLGTPVLSLWGAIGAGLTIGIRGHGLLLPVLIMPLYIPILIFGTSAVITAHSLYPISGYFAIMSAILLFSLAFSPLLTSMALRTGVNQ